MITTQQLVDEPMSDDDLRILHDTIKKVTDDLESMSFNTAISQMMIFINHFAGNGKKLNRDAAEIYTLLLAPFAPLLGEELWEFLGHAESLAYEPWPQYDEQYLKVDQVEVLVQVNGRPKARIVMAAGSDQDAMRVIALQEASVQAAVTDKKIVKVICVPDRLVNIVAV
jgi:leucyl-tRNA synthetase